MPEDNDVKLLNQLTLCSVSFYSNDLLNINLETTLRLNKIDMIRWIVVDNNIDINKLEQPFLNPLFEVIKGESNSFTGKVKGSYHHAQALNIARKYVSTRFLLLIDPDFFIIRPNWIEEILNHMVENNISIFGAPYYPSYNFKPRYFPCVICMFIDLEKVHINDLDFTPELYEHILVKEFSNEELLRFILGLPTPHTDQANRFKRATLIEVALNNLRNRYIYSILSKKFPNFAKKNLSISRDTGYKIFRQYHRSIYFKNECLTPAFTNPLYDESVKKQSLVEKALYHFVPDSLSKYPLRRNYTVNRFFRDFNLPDINRLGWEEYFWQNSPFGFHVKGSSSKDNFSQDLKMGQLLGQF